MTKFSKFADVFMNLLNYINNIKRVAVLFTEMVEHHE